MGVNVCNTNTTKHIRLPPLFCGVRITYAYPHCFVEIVLHTLNPVVLWSSYYVRLPLLFCGVRITYVYPHCFVEIVLHTLNPVVLWSSHHKTMGVSVYNTNSTKQRG
jgi:ABC-type uncharacterized transport system substrate-binding protein